MVHPLPAALPLSISIRVQFRRGIARLLPPERGQQTYRLVISPSMTFGHAVAILQDGLRRLQKTGLQLRGIEARGKYVDTHAVLGWSLMNAEIFRVGLQQGPGESNCLVM